MVERSPPGKRGIRVLHVLRSPVGGLFRHVLDLTREQVARGHEVGLVVDRTTGGAIAEQALAEITPQLALGLTRIPMHRNPHPSDVVTLARVAGLISAARADVVHGHGSKGGLYARLSGGWPGSRRGPARVYTPHGGSLHFFDPASPRHRLYTGVERFLARYSDLILFESAFAAERYRAMISSPGCLTRVVLNGVRDAEFEPVAATPEAADFLYVGELRALKGVDTFLDAFASACTTTGRGLRAVLAGSGPDRERFEAWGRRLGLGDQVTFTGPLPARTAFGLGRVLVVPSRAESLPYIVLEAAAAQIPIVATRVGGIPEIFGPWRDQLVPSDDPQALRTRMLQTLELDDAERQRTTRELARHVQAHFSIRRMTDGIIDGYRDALAARTAQHPGGLRDPRISPPRYGL